MPKLEKAVPEVDQLVMRPVALEIIQDVLVNRLGLPSTLTVNFPGDTDGVAQARGFISSPNEDARFPTTDKFTIQVSEAYIEDYMPSIQTKGPEHIPLFLNRELELEMRPIYASVEMTISIHYRAKNKTEARRWYDMMSMKLPNREDTWLHTLNYSFGIPQPYIEILKEIHRCTEAVASYGDTYEQFFEKWVNPRWGWLTNQSGERTMGVFSETQNRCIGFFQQQPVPDFGSRSNETDVWDIEFPYVLRYEKIKEIYFEHPIIIHNQILSPKWRNTEGFQRLQDQQTSRTWSMAHLKSFESMQNVGKPYNDFPGRYFPTYDEFMPRMVNPNTMRVFTCLVQLAPDDAADPYLLMNLKDLEDPAYALVLSAAIKQFASTEAPWITLNRQSALNVSVYMGRNVLDGRLITVDSDLNVRSKQILNKRLYYHVRFAVITDLTYLTDDAKERLKDNPDALEGIIEYILPEGSNFPKPPTQGGSVLDPWFDQVAEQLHGRVSNVSMKTVQYTKMNAVYNMQK